MARVTAPTKPGPTLGKDQLSSLLYGFLDAIYLFQRREEGLFGASWQDIYLLKRLADHGELSVGQVAQALRVPVFGASRILSRLEASGLVRKRPDRDSGRIKLIAITPGGRKLLGEVEEYQYGLITSNLAVLEEGELASLTAGLGKLRALLGLEAPGDEEARGKP